MSPGIFHLLENRTYLRISNCKTTKYFAHNIVEIIIVFINVVRNSLLSIYLSVMYILYNSRCIKLIVETSAVEK